MHSLCAALDSGQHDTVLVAVAALMLAASAVTSLRRRRS